MKNILNKLKEFYGAEVDSITINNNVITIVKENDTIEVKQQGEAYIVILNNKIFDTGYCTIEVADIVDECLMRGYVFPKEILNPRPVGAKAKIKGGKK